jgi:hypothetical protein
MIFYDVFFTALYYRTKRELNEMCIYSVVLFPFPDKMSPSRVKIEGEYLIYKDLNEKKMDGEDEKGIPNLFSKSSLKTHV